MSEYVLKPGETAYFRAPPGETVTVWRSNDKTYGKVKATGTPPVEPPPEPEPEPEPEPVPSGPGLVISPAALQLLPTTGGAWTTLSARASGSWGTADLKNQDNKHCVGVLAGALVATRTANAAMKARAIDGIEDATGTEQVGSGNSILSLGRQLGAYVIAADLVGYRDPAFVSWVSAIRTQQLGGHGRWGQLRFCAGDTANNWGTFALASIIAADAYLADKANLDKDWLIFKGYGDATWPFNKTSSYSAAWQGNAGKFIAINPVGTRGSDGKDLDGCPVEDASRSSYPTASPYVHEAMQGYVVQALLLERQGYAAWGVNANQVLRAAKFADRFNVLNDHSVGYYVAHLVNAKNASTLPEKTPTDGGRVFGFTDWLY